MSGCARRFPDFGLCAQEKDALVHEHVPGDSCENEETGECSRDYVYCHDFVPFAGEPGSRDLVTLAIHESGIGGCAQGFGWGECEENTVAFTRTEPGAELIRRADDEPRLRAALEAAREALRDVVDTEGGAYEHPDAHCTPDTECAAGHVARVLRELDAALITPDTTG